MRKITKIESIVLLLMFLIGIGILSLSIQVSQAQQTTNEPPTITIIKPELKSLYFRDCKILPSLQTMIVGYITVKASATDDTEIQRVEFYVDGELRNITTAVHHCGSHMWVWNERIWAQSKHTLTVVAVDMDGLTAQDNREVVINNIPLLHPVFP